MDACDLATKYADKIMAARDLQELTFIGKEIATHKFEGDLLLWLRDMWTSRRDTLNTPVKPDEEILNASGRKWYAKQKLDKSVNI